MAEHYLTYTENLHQSLPINVAGRDFVVGDIHGKFNKLERELTRVGFNKSVDRLISVGDLVDRGEQSHLAEQYLSESWFYAVRGNHEDLAILWANKDIPEKMYSRNGGDWNISRSEQDVQKTADLFSRLPIAIDVEVNGKKVGIVHAECPYDSWDTLKDVLNGKAGKQELINACQTSLWSRERFTKKNNSTVSGLSFLFVGHTPVKTPIALGNVLYIDTGAAYKEENPITILNIHDFTK